MDVDIAVKDLLTEYKNVCLVIPQDLSHEKYCEALEMVTQDYTDKILELFS